MPVDGLFSFSSDAGLNLHHLLLAEGWAVEAAESDRRSQAPTAVRDLALRTRPAFDEAVAYYRTQMIERNLFDDTMRDLSLWLTSRGGSAPAGWDEVFSPALDEYWTSDWPCHHQHNLNWSERTAADLAGLLPGAIDRLQQVYRQQLPDSPVPVNVVYVGGLTRRGLPAYTSLHPTHVTCSSTHSGAQGLTAVEIVLHETSHALADDLRQSSRRHVGVTQPGIGQLWHVVLFFLTGEIVVRLFAQRGVEYTPYLDSTGLFDRAWPQFRRPVTDAWTGYLDNDWDWDTAWQRLADGIRQQ